MFNVVYFLRREEKLVNSRVLFNVPGVRPNGVTGDILFFIVHFERILSQNCCIYNDVNYVIVGIPNLR